MIRICTPRNLFTNTLLVILIFGNNIIFAQEQAANYPFRIGINNPVRNPQTGMKRVFPLLEDISVKGIRHLNYADVSWKQVEPQDDPWNFVFTDDFLWITDLRSRHLIKCARDSTFSYIEEYSLPGPSPSGIAWDGQHLWTCDDYTGKVYKHLQLTTEPLDPEDEILSAGSPVTEIDGSITSDTHLSIAQSPYLIPSGLTIERDATLTIDPGVKIFLAKYAAIVVNGTLKAIGTADSLIVFSHQNANEYWGIISFNNPDTSEAARSVLSDTKIQYLDGIYLYRSTPDIHDNIFQNSRFAISVGHSRNITIHNNSFSGPSVTAIGLAYNSADVSITNNTITDCQRQAILLFYNAEAEIHYNNIYNNDVALSLWSEGAYIDASYNWWGTTNPDSIENLIEDHNDDPTSGRVNYLPFLNSPVGNSSGSYPIMTRVEEQAPRGDFRLLQNYPNPFNTTTAITFSIPSINPGDVRVILKIYNVRGQVIRELVDEKMKPGPHSVVWEGNSNSGKSVGSGIYFYELRVGDLRKTGKMLMIK